MSKNPNSIRPSPALHCYISSSNKGVTAAINDLFDRYQIMRSGLALKLTAEEAEVIRSMLFGVAMNDSQFLIACLALPQDINDEEFINLAGAKTLAEKLKNATPAQLVATIDSLGY